MKDNKFKTHTREAAVKAMMKSIPDVVGTDAVNHFKKSFRDGGFTDKSFNRWRARKKRDAGRAVLVKSGRLRRSIRVVSKNSKRVVIGTNVEYASYHNYGTEKLPRRKFIGNSRKLIEAITNKIQKKYRKAMTGRTI